MEDQQYGVFHLEKKQLLYKQILTHDEIDKLNDECLNSVSCSNSGGLATGCRMYSDVDLRAEYRDICDRLFVVLRDYFPDLQISPHARFYSHKYGAIKPHVDQNHDNKSNYTLLLYLTDDFDDGKLSIKTKRSNEEIEKSFPDKFHKVFVIKPICGYAIIFNKELLHWASEIYTGEKNFLLVHFYSLW